MTIHEWSNKYVSNLFQKRKAIFKIRIAQKFVLVSCATPSTDWYAKKKISRQFQFWERGPASSSGPGPVHRLVSAIAQLWNKSHLKTWKLVQNYSQTSVFNGAIVQKCTKYHLLLADMWKLVHRLVIRRRDWCVLPIAKWSFNSTWALTKVEVEATRCHMQALQMFFSWAVYII